MDNNIPLEWQEYLKARIIDLEPKRENIFDIMESDMKFNIKARIPLPKQTEEVFHSKSQYTRDRKDTRDYLAEAEEEKELEQVEETDEDPLTYRP